MVTLCSQIYGVSCRFYDAAIAEKDAPIATIFYLNSIFSVRQNPRRDVYLQHRCGDYEKI
ncbi:MAG: hypothetical protein HC799_12090 [Limnothrix sp. RL_2_0]|nr:hypothetical protein [Limnothrix sp. RL_2_0]